MRRPFLFARCLLLSTACLCVCAAAWGRIYNERTLKKYGDESLGIADVNGYARVPIGKEFLLLEGDPPYEKDPDILRQMWVGPVFSSDPRRGGGIFGPCWEMALLASGVEVKDNRIIWKRPDGIVTALDKTADADGRTYQDHPRQWRGHVEGNRVEFSHALVPNFKCVYQDGRLERLCLGTRQGHELEVRYDAQNRPIEVADLTNGETPVRLVYDKDGHVAEATINGKPYRFTYAQAELRFPAARGEMLVSTDYPDGRQERYTYGRGKDAPRHAMRTPFEMVELDTGPVDRLEIHEKDAPARWFEWCARTGFMMADHEATYAVGNPALDPVLREKCTFAPKDIDLSLYGVSPWVAVAFNKKGYQSPSVWSLDAADGSLIFGSLNGKYGREATRYPPQPPFFYEKIREERRADGTWRLGMASYFDAQGKLMHRKRHRETDGPVGPPPNCERPSYIVTSDYTHHPNGRIAMELSLSQGKVIREEYDAYGKLQRIYEDDKIVQECFYDAQRRLILSRESKGERHVFRVAEGVRYETYFIPERLEDMRLSKNLNGRSFSADAWIVDAKGHRKSFAPRKSAPKDMVETHWKFTEEDASVVRAFPQVLSQAELAKTLVQPPDEAAAHFADALTRTENLVQIVFATAIGDAQETEADSLNPDTPRFAQRFTCDDALLPLPKADFIVQTPMPLFTAPSSDGKLAQWVLLLKPSPGKKTLTMREDDGTRAPLDGPFRLAGSVRAAAVRIAEEDKTAGPLELFLTQKPAFFADLRAIHRALFQTEDKPKEQRCADIETIRTQAATDLGRQTAQAVLGLLGAPVQPEIPPERKPTRDLENMRAFLKQMHARYNQWDYPPPKDGQ